MSERSTSELRPAPYPSWKKIVSMRILYRIWYPTVSECIKGNLFNDTLNLFYLLSYGVRQREETCCSHMGYSFRLAAMVLLYESCHRQDNTYVLCYTSCEALAGRRNSSMVSTMKDWSDDPSCHERMLLPGSYISLLNVLISKGYITYETLYWTLHNRTF